MKSMEKKSIIKNEILGLFQLVTLGMLVYCIALLSNQQRELNNLRSSITNIEYSCDISDLEYKLDEVESNLSSEIDGVRRTVILWSD